MKSVSSPEESLKVFRQWKHSSREMIVISAGADGRSVFNIKGYIQKLSEEWLVVATADGSGYIALSLPGVEFGVTKSTGVSGDPIDEAKESFPDSDVMEIKIREGGRVVIIPSPFVSR
jgi:hypothetical protein